MAIYYVGIGGNNTNDGLSWGNRKLTVQAAENLASAGDTVYVGPGTYREEWTLAASGSSGNPITFVADTSGIHTDGIGGRVRVTGANAGDTAPTRSYCVNNFGNRSYRTFIGFQFDTPLYHIVIGGNSMNVTFNCCTFIGAQDQWINVDGDSQANWLLKNCRFFSGSGDNGNEAVVFQSSTNISTGHIVENCTFMAAFGFAGVRCINAGGVTIRNCTVFGLWGLLKAQGLTHPVTVNNCIVTGCAHSVWADGAGMVNEDYNCFFNNKYGRNNVTAGANSVAYPPLLDFPPQIDGIRIPHIFNELSADSQIKWMTGVSPSATDLYGVARPANGKISYGAVQFGGVQREATTVRTGAASLKLTDAARRQTFVPVTAESTTFSVYAYRQADYAGTLPQMVIRQPGVADTTVTDTGAVGQWNLLTTTFTPSAGTDYVVVELASNNTATSGNYAVFFDDLSVS